MAFNFPDSPVEGQEYTPAIGITYIYQAPRWVVKFDESSSGIEEAPTDGEIYGRQTLGWVPVPDPPVGEAPMDGGIYARQNATWQPLATTAMLMEYAARTISIISEDPGNGKISWNTATQGDATQLYISERRTDNTDMTNVWNSFEPGQQIVIQRKIDSARVAKYDIVSITDNSTWFQLEVTPVSAAGLPFTGNEELLVGVLSASGSGSGGGSADGITVTPGGGISSDNVQDAITELDTEKVNKAGDIMSGDLEIVKSLPTLVLDKPAGNDAASIYARRLGVNRWRMILGSGTAESGGDAGSNFSLNCYNDAGATIASALTIERKTGLVTLGGGHPIATFGAATKGYVDTYAAPFDAMAYNGMQINGCMEVSQENGANTVSVSMTDSINTDKIICDGWHVVVAGGGAGGSILAASPGITVGTDGYIFPSRLQIMAQTHAFNATPDASLVLRQFIEGYRMARLGFGFASAQPITISFHIYVNYAGTMGLSLRNLGATRNITKAVSLNAGWNYRSVTFPGDITGTWERTDKHGMYVDFCLAAGANELEPVDVWSSAIGFGPASGQTNFVADTSGATMLTGVTMLPGTQAPTAAQSLLIMRPYDQELVTCQRYFEKHSKLDYCTAFVNSPTIVRAVYPFLQKRATPTVTLGGGFAFNTNSGVTVLSSPSANQIEASGQFLFQGAGAGLTGGMGGALIDQAASSVTIDARL